MKSKKHALFIGIILACIGMLGAYLSFYYFLHKEIKETQEKETRILQLQEKDKEIVTQKKLIDETKEMRSLLEQYFVSEEAVVDFLEQFEALDIATGTDTVISSVDVVEPTGKGAVGNPMLLLSLESDGTFSGVYHLLTLLELLPYEIQIGKVAFSRTALSSEAGSTPLWNLSTSFTVQSFLPSTQQ